MVNVSGKENGRDDHVAALANVCPAPRSRSWGFGLATARGHGRHDLRAIHRRLRRRIPAQVMPALPRRCASDSEVGSLIPSPARGGFRTLCGEKHAQAARAREPRAFADFLGFTFIAADHPANATSDGRDPAGPHASEGLKMIKEECWRHSAQPIPLRRKWLWYVVNGCFNLRAVPDQCPCTACVPAPHRRSHSARCGGADQRGSST